MTQSLAKATMSGTKTSHAAGTTRKASTIAITHLSTNPRCSGVIRELSPIQGTLGDSHRRRHLSPSLPFPLPKGLGAPLLLAARERKSPAFAGLFIGADDGTRT